VDTCVWNGISCIYKQLEFDGLIPQMQREISSRESLLCHFNGTDPTLLSTLGVSPILAVVVHGNPALLYGILLPNVGITFESVADSHIAVRHLVSLVRTVRYLLAAEVVHGDIWERNVCLDGASVQLIDFGEVVPERENDVVASGELLLRCMKRMMLTNAEKETISKAASELIERKNPHAALVMLEEIDDEVCDGSS